VPIVPVSGGRPPAEPIELAVEALRGGDIIALPTDTVYGLAADPFNAGATDRLFAVKRRARELELPVLVAGIEQALGMTVSVPGSALRLMQRHWPGGLTIVLPRKEGLGADLGGGGATIGMRCPDHPVALALCRSFGPVAATSANRHGQTPAATAAEVDAELGEGVSLILDGGRCAGNPSTVVDCTGEMPRLLREGCISWPEVLAAAEG
jgi:tRNA threonylcarbamoyl adenosine modification protein (Sua5/YciO/YrdC/YwlC family)